MLSSIIQQNSKPITTNLMAAFQFHMPYLTREGNPSTLLVATGPHGIVNATLGLSFIQQTCMIIDTAHQVTELSFLDLQPYAINFCQAMCTVPPFGKAPNASHFSDIIAEIIKSSMTQVNNPAVLPLPFYSLRSRRLSMNSTSMSLLIPPFEDKALTFPLLCPALLLLLAVLSSPISMWTRMLVITSGLIFLSQSEPIAPT